MKNPSFALAALVLIGGCQEQSVPATQDPAPANEARVLVDFRHADTGPRSLTNPDSARGIVEAVFGNPTPNDVWLADEATGSFTEAGRSQRLYLLARGTPMARGESVSRPILAVFDNDEVVAQFVPPEVPVSGIASYTRHRRRWPGRRRRDRDRLSNGPNDYPSRCLELCGRSTHFVTTARHGLRK